MKKILISLVLFAVWPSSARATENEVSVTRQGDYYYVQSNGIPDHATGRFPNAGNPNSISPQNYTFRFPVSPQYTGRATAYGHNLFGVALNGIPFDPETAEFWKNDHSSGWNYEALSGKINLGVDQNHAHVQPGGAYHYHGTPEGLLKNPAGPQLIGYAADGFPVYYQKSVKPSYRIKSGTRPSGPGGNYDGSFVQDYEFAAGSGDLDECNGRTGVTADYPDGIYHYYITDTFPFVPRCHKGLADPSFVKSRPHTGRGGGRDDGGSGPPRPPQEAIDSCSGKNQGSPCSFDAPRGTVSGQCRDLQGELACVPSGRR